MLRCGQDFGAFKVTDEYVTGCALFLRNGCSRAQILHRGTREECERVQDLVPGVAVNGDEDVIEAKTFIWPAAKWDEFEARVIAANNGAGSTSSAAKDT